MALAWPVKGITSDENHQAVKCTRSESVSSENRSCRTGCNKSEIRETPSDESSSINSCKQRETHHRRADALATRRSINSENQGERRKALVAKTKASKRKSTKAKAVKRHLKAEAKNSARCSRLGFWVAACSCCQSHRCQVSNAANLVQATVVELPAWLPSTHSKLVDARACKGSMFHKSQGKWTHQNYCNEISNWKFLGVLRLPNISFLVLYGNTGAAWRSINSKYAILVALRATAQITFYEIRKKL